jgi:GNAT superfamily N-acetyltransferase
MASQVGFRRDAQAGLPLLEPVWVSVHHHHADVMAELAATGVHDLVLGVLPGNAAAIRLYQRCGFRPAWAYLSRFGSR